MTEEVGAQRVAFVTGGSGFVGGKLIQALVSRGWEVRALARGQKAAASVKALGAMPVIAELTDRDALSRSITGSEVVFTSRRSSKCGEAGKNSTPLT